MHFEANVGQADPRVAFVARGQGYALALTDAEARLTLAARRPAADATAPTKLSPPSTVLTMTLAGASAHAHLAPLDALPGKSNYFIGADPARWRTNVPTYSKVRQPQVYPGVDLIYYGNQQQLEYDFVVAPATDPSVVRMAFDGAEDLVIDGDGDLLATMTPGDVIRLRRPVAYQVGSGRNANRAIVEARYVLDGKRRVGFEVGAFDRTRPLVIDPVLQYATYLGGNKGDEPGSVFGNGRTIAVDADGSAYITGQTEVPFPVTAGALQTSPPPSLYGQVGAAFVTKLSPDGSSLVYSTYLGGTNALYNGSARGQGIAIDTDGSAYVSGFTDSGAFPVTFPRSADGGTAFVTKIDPNGSSIVYSYQFGGNGDTADGIAVDAAGDAYVTGTTTSPHLPGLFGAGAEAARDGGRRDRDAFVAKIDPSGSFDYARYLGGHGHDGGYNIAADRSGNAYVTGYTTPYADDQGNLINDFPTAAAAQPAPGFPVGSHGSLAQTTDAFVTKIDATGTALVYSTYLGGREDEDLIPGFGPPAGDLAVDQDGNAFVTGLTLSPDFPTTPGAFESTLSGSIHAFVAKYGPSGAIVYSTLLGGSNQDIGRGIAVDAGGHALVTGDTSSSDFPLTADALQTEAGMYVTMLDATGGHVLYSTLFGSPAGGESARALAIDRVGSVYLVGTTSAGDSTFPATPDAFQTTPGGDGDVFVAKVSFGVPDATPPTIRFDQRPDGSHGWFITAPASVRVTATDEDGGGVASLGCTIDGNVAALSNSASTSTSLSGTVEVSTDGDHLVACEASDPAGNATRQTDAGNSTHLELDSTPPTITVGASSTVLWPPNGKRIPDSISGFIADGLSGVEATSVTFTVVDTYGLVQPSGVVSLGPGGRYSFTVSLEARRLGQDPAGRQYRVVVSASDRAGNRAAASTLVSVPHDRGH
ncbi:MAG TPA: SBBP repeat-containing protein [Vicinamibacterales bacterium]|nr:SBBP repeat-containing protein [Vicinamibacterales bacterium]